MLHNSVVRGDNNISPNTRRSIDYQFQYDFTYMYITYICNYLSLNSLAIFDDYIVSGNTRFYRVSIEIIIDRFILSMQ